ncbi:MAG: LysM peptidoglycan-binding domain-containing protein [Chloroflexi bacterium]|nr:LysM peptidoglycan-binding domain-containing protein [Chloroflexota bacterium]
MAEKAAREREAASERARLGKAAAERKVNDLKAKVEAGAEETRSRLDEAVAAAREKASAAAKEAAGAGKYTVKAGDTLSTIARDILGDGARWKEIYELNKAAIGANPDVIKAGIELTLPK